MRITILCKGFALVQRCCHYYRQLTAAIDIKLHIYLHYCHAPISYRSQCNSRNHLQNPINTSMTLSTPHVAHCISNVSLVIDCFQGEGLVTTYVHQLLCQHVNECRKHLLLNLYITIHVMVCLVYDGILKRLLND